MAIKKKRSSPKGGKVNSALAMAKKYSSSLKKKKTTKSKPSKGGKVKGALKVGASIVDNAMMAYTGSSSSSIKQAFKSGSGKAAGSGRRHRKGVVPKTVRKWAGKITRRRKSEEKIIKKLFGADGGKIVKKPKSSRYGTPGVITRAEALEAMRR